MFGGDAKRLKLLGGDFVRRSSRRVKVRGEREFIVNSDMLLRDFKVKVRYDLLTFFINQAKLLLLLYCCSSGGGMWWWCTEQLC